MGIQTTWNNEINGKKVGVYNCLGKVVDVDDMAADSYHGPTKFNLFFVDFNGMFVDLIEDVVEPNKRIKNNILGLNALAFGSDEVLTMLNDLIEVVNYSSRPLVSDDRKKKYSNLMQKIATKISDYRKVGNFNDLDLTVVPMKGGSYFLNYLENRSVHKNTLAIECKRIPVAKENSFCFGMAVAPSDEFPLNSQIKNISSLMESKRIRIVELCIVSGMTTIGFLLYLKENNIRPESVEINTIAISQQGYEVINEFAKNQGINVEFVTGGVYYRLGNYYLSRRDELLTLDGKSVIGDVRSFLD